MYMFFKISFWLLNSSIVLFYVVFSTHRAGWDVHVLQDLLLVVEFC